jgi:hypothetical protein
MWFERSSLFVADWKSLTDDEQAAVRSVLPAVRTAADDVAAHSFDHRRWPKSLRIHDIENAPGVWSVTFNFAAPDLRATFDWSPTREQPTVRWRRIGNHGVYRRP